MLRSSHKKVEKHAHMLGYLHLQTRHNEKRPPPPILDLKTKFLPLKFPWNLVVKRAQKVASKSFERWYKRLHKPKSKRGDNPLDSIRLKPPF